jgi:hypothetical protein
MAIIDDLEILQYQLAQVDFLTTPSRSGNTSDLSFLLVKKDRLKFKMYQEPGHALPHIHIDYGNLFHAASYRIDPPSRLTGKLDRKFDKTIIEWIAQRKNKLLEAWALVQAGGDPTNFTHELAGDIQQSDRWSGT